jgi:DNA-binding NarL/FixJ family response regulator
MRQPIRVLLADDHTIVREGIRAIIQRLGSAMDVVGEAANGQDVLKQARQYPVDVFVLDLEMPRLDGIETTERLRQQLGPVKVVFLSMYDEKIMVERAIRAGVKGYILKESASEEIVRAIEEVYRGGYYFSPKIAGYMAQDFLQARTSKEPPPLTTALSRRQMEILKRISQGLTEKEIAFQLNISPNTVHVHINNIMKKVDIHNKAGLIKYAIKLGIVQL